MKNETQLPHAPHEFMELALQDLEKCENMKEYRIDMSEWHTVEGLSHSDDDKPVYECAVCLAGAVMAQTLDIDKDVTLGYGWRNYFEELNEAKLEAINCFRMGSLKWGMEKLVLETETKSPSLPTGQHLHHIYYLMQQAAGDVEYRGKLKLVYEDISATELYEHDPNEFKRFIREQVIPELKRLWDDALAKSVPA